MERTFKTILIMLKEIKIQPKCNECLDLGYTGEGEDMELCPDCKEKGLTSWDILSDRARKEWEKPFTAEENEIMRKILKVRL